MKRNDWRALFDRFGGYSINSGEEKEINGKDSDFMAAVEKFLKGRRNYFLNVIQE